MATVEDVNQVLDNLLARLANVDESMRAKLPPRRIIEVRCPDLSLIRYARWNNGTVATLAATPERSDIRFSVRSDDLVAIDDGRLSVGKAYASNRLRIDASMSDLLRLRAIL